LLPDDRVALERGVLVGALMELSDPPERLLEFQLELLLVRVDRVSVDLVSVDGVACIQRF
jgi:hypothetical protein